jgi:hypothetical protein
MNTLIRITTVACLVAATAASTASAADLAQLHRPTTISAYRNVVVWSAYDGQTRSYRLMLRRGDQTTTLPVAASSKDFDADVSRGPNGQPWIVYSRCRRDGGCSLARYDVPSGRERRITAAGHAKTPIIATSWGQRLVWAGHASRRTTLMTARPDGQSPRTLAVLPRHNAIDDLELLGGRLAIVQSEWDGVSVRLRGLDGSRPRTVARRSSGESQPWFIGLSYNTGALYFAQICLGDTAGCSARQTFVRYRDGRYAIARGPVQLAGFAIANNHAYQVTQGFSDCIDDKDNVCLVQTLGPLNLDPVDHLSAR